MRVIVDTHIFIYREYEKALPKDLQKLLAGFTKLGIKIFAHPLSLKEIEHDANLRNPQVILSKVKTYPIIASPPDANTDDVFLNIVGIPEDPRDDADNQLLYCIYKNTSDYLITEDRDIHRKSKKIKISDRVFGLKEALNYFQKQPDVQDTSPIHAAKPTFCFFKSGDIWHIGASSMSKNFTNTKGLEFIHFLLKNPNRYFSPNLVYNMDQTSIMYSEHMKNETGIKKLNSHELKEREILKNKYQKTLEDGDYEIAEDAVWLKKEIRRLNMEIKKKVERDSRSIHEKCRVNVYRRIDSALKKIHKFLPEMESFLNKTTIKTGDSICYSPIEHAQPIWILREEDRPTEKSRQT